MLDGLHAQPVAAIDEGRSSLELADKVAKVLGLAIVVQLLDGSFGHDGGLVRVHDEFIAVLLLGISPHSLASHRNAVTPSQLGGRGRQAEAPVGREAVAI